MKKRPQSGLLWRRRKWCSIKITHRLYFDVRLSKNLPIGIWIDLSPDLAPSNFFPRLKVRVEGQRFSSNEYVIASYFAKQLLFKWVKGVLASLRKVYRLKGRLSWKIKMNFWSKKYLYVIGSKFFRDDPHISLIILIHMYMRSVFKIYK